jgi:hypothetical protein
MVVLSNNVICSSVVMFDSSSILGIYGLVLLEVFDVYLFFRAKFLLVEIV